MNYVVFSSDILASCKPPELFTERYFFISSLMSNLFEFIKFSLAFVRIKNTLHYVQLGGGEAIVNSPEGKSGN